MDQDQAERVIDCLRDISNKLDALQSRMADVESECNRIACRVSNVDEIYESVERIRRNMD